MPRLNNTNYTNRHRWLRQLWLKSPRTFSILRPNQQWDVHDYYRPSEKLTSKQLLAHRRHITKTRPALPQRASKALMVLAGIAPVPKPTSVKYGKRRIVVRALVQPQIDVERLARALMALAEHQVSQEMKRLQK